jgi:hypothetical protein
LSTLSEGKLNPALLEILVFAAGSGYWWAREGRDRLWRLEGLSTTAQSMVLTAELYRHLVRLGQKVVVRNIPFKETE